MTFSRTACSESASVTAICVVAGSTFAGWPGCHTRSRYAPGATAAMRALPSAPLRACSGLSTTSTHAAMLSWMLQPSTAMPGLSNSTGTLGTPAYSFSSKVLMDENEYTW